MSKLNALHPVMIAIENPNEHLDAKNYPVNVIKVSYISGATFLFLNVLDPDKKTRRWVPIGDSEGGSFGLDELNAEIANRKAADIELLNLITQKVLAEQNARTIADEAEASARSDADNNLDTKIAAETTARQSAITATEQKITKAVAAETSARETAITAITNSKSHTVGIETKPDGSKEVKQDEVATMGVGNTEDPLVLKSYVDFLKVEELSEDQMDDLLDILNPEDGE